MTTISLLTTDQFLSVASRPKVASGDVKSVLLEVRFDAEWDGYVKSAVFFTSENSPVYEVPMLDEECLVPHEVLAKSGILYIGVRGVDTATDAVKTSSLVEYRIVEGAPAGDGTTVEPTADVYQQLLKLAEETRQIAQEVRNDFEAGAIPALEEQNKKESFMFWVGTKAEYEAQKDSLPKNTYCIITDDTSKAEMLAEIAALKEMQGVDLSESPILYDVTEFDYFMVQLTDNRKLYFFETYTGSVGMSAYTFREYMYWLYQYELYFNKTDDGYTAAVLSKRFDSTVSFPSTSVTETYKKIYGFKSVIRR